MTTKRTPINGLKNKPTKKTKCIVCTSLCLELDLQKSDFEKKIKEYEQLLEAEKTKYEQLSQTLYGINTNLREDFNEVCENNVALRTENTFYKKIIDKLTK